MKKGCIKTLASSVFAVVSAIVFVEVVGLNRHVRNVVQIGFTQLETVLGATLALLLLLYLLKNNRAELRFWRLVGVGFVGGLCSGVIAVISLSVLPWNQRGIFNSHLSVRDFALYLGISMVGTWGWLIGSLAAIILYFTSGKSKTG